MKSNYLTLTSRTGFSVMVLLVFFIAAEWTPSIGDIFIKDAEARIGRPASPGSVAGVHRRHRRRAVRRHAIAGARVATLPAGCSNVIRAGVSYNYCGGVYYRPYYEGNTVVYEVVEP